MLSILLFSTPPQPDSTSYLDSQFVCKSHFNKKSIFNMPCGLQFPLQLHTHFKPLQKTPPHIHTPANYLASFPTSCILVLPTYFSSLPLLIPVSQCLCILQKQWEVLKSVFRWLTLTDLLISFAVSRKYAISQRSSAFSPRINFILV